MYLMGMSAGKSENLAIFSLSTIPEPIKLSLKHARNLEILLSEMLQKQAFLLDKFCPMMEKITDWLAEIPPEN